MSHFMRLLTRTKKYKIKNKLNDFRQFFDYFLSKLSIYTETHDKREKKYT